MFRSKSVKAYTMLVVATSLVALLGAVLPNAMSHPDSQPAPGELTYGPAAYQNPLGWSFNGPKFTSIDRAPCNNDDLVYGRALNESEDPKDPNTVKDPFFPGDEIPHEQQTYSGGSQQFVPHIGHLYAARAMTPVPWDASPSDWVHVPADGVTNYHLDSYENPADFEANDWATSVMMGTDGFFDFHFGTTITEDPTATDVILVDFHDHASYCIWARPYWDESGTWLFAGSAFVQPDYDWDLDGNNDFAGEASASEIELSLYYEDLFREQYPWWEPGRSVEAYHFLVQSSLEKYPAVRSWFTYDVPPVATQIATAQPPPQKNDGALGIYHMNPDDPLAAISYDYVYDENDPNTVVQEHWLILNETARRFGWPERDLTNIRDNTPDPILAWEWYLDTDPRPSLPNGQKYPDGSSGDTSLQERDCPSALCTKDFPFPNPLKQRLLPSEVYLDDPAYGEDGKYNMCLFTYTADAVDDQNNPPNIITGQMAKASKANSDFYCQEVTVVNIPPVAFAEESPRWEHGDPHPRTRQFFGSGFDPDGIPECIESISWFFQNETTPFAKVYQDYARNVAEGTAGADASVFANRWHPNHTFEDPGVKKVKLTLIDCNGGVSEPAMFYVNIPKNQPPYIDQVEDRRIQTGETVCYWVVGHDPEQYPLQILTHDQVPPGFTPEQAPTGNSPYSMCWTPTQNQIGTYTIRLWTKDDVGALGEMIFTIQVYNPDQDFDEDGIPDFKDLCPGLDDVSQADMDGDNIGDACDTDRDGDGCHEGLTECATIVIDDQLVPNDAFANDRDRDGINDHADNCPDTKNMNQRDFDRDGFGDACDFDLDGDGILQISDGEDVFLDNCPDVPNGDQRDSDNDGIGDACDSDLLLAGGDNKGRPITAADCDDCAEAAPVAEPKSGVMSKIGTGGVIGIIGGVLIIGFVTVGLTTWSVRKWKE